MRTHVFTCVSVPLAATILVGVLVAETTAQRRRDNSVFGIPVSTNTLVDDPGSYVGRLVTVSAGVERMLSTTAFLVDQRRMVNATTVAPAGKPIMVIAPFLAVPLEPSRYVMVTGRLIRFESDDLSRLVPDHVSDLPEDVASQYAGQPVIVATSVVDSQYSELVRRPPAPLLPEEVAMSDAMKSVSTAATALRSAAQDARTAAVVEQAAALQPIFTRVEIIWDDLGQVPAAQMAREARGLALTIERAGRAGDWTAVNAGVASLNQACGSCHGAYRDRTDAGTFRFRAGSF